MNHAEIKQTVQFRKSAVEFSPTKKIKEEVTTHGRSMSVIGDGLYPLSNDASSKSIFKQTSHARTSSIFRNPRDSLFYIPNEDRIFDDEKVKSCIDFIQKIKSDKSKIELKKDIKIERIYKTNADSLKKLKIAKKKKFLDLENYQRNLIMSASEILSKDSIRTLETRLTKVRKKANEIKHIEHMDPLFEQIKEEDELTLWRLKESYMRIIELRNRIEDKAPNVEKQEFLNIGEYENNVCL